YGKPHSAMLLQRFDHLQVGAVHVGLMTIWNVICIAFSLF
ncbi:hypothetical protein TorRG33x02_337650, partial [Trema orientale]